MYYGDHILPSLSTLIPCKKVVYLTVLISFFYYIGSFTNAGDSSRMSLGL